MADIKDKPLKSDERQDIDRKDLGRSDEGSRDMSAEELRRRARHQEEDEPTRRNATDEDVGQDRSQQKGFGGSGAQEGTAPRSAPPLSDKSGRRQ